MYLPSEQADGTCATEVLRSRYYAVPVERLLELLEATTGEVTALKCHPSLAQACSQGAAHA